MLRSSRCLLLLGMAYGFAVSAQSTADKPQLDVSPATAPPTKQSSTTAPAYPAAHPSDSPPDPLGEAKALVRKGDFDAAIAKYQQLLQERPKSPDAYAGLTRVYLRKKDVAQAYETVTKALEVTDSWPVRVALGEVYFRQGKISEAEMEWVDVINSGHQAARAYLGLARVRWATSKYKSAKAMIDKAHALDPKDPEIEGHSSRTLSHAERIRHLEDYLATLGNDDPARASAQGHLDALKARIGSDLTCTLVSKVASTETPLLRMLTDPQHMRGVGLSVFVNQQKSRLLLDTGAGGIMLNRGMAERAGVTKLTDTHIGGIGDQGSKPGYVAVARSISIGDLEFKNCPVRVIDTRTVLGQDGLIGADVFEHFLVDIDFPYEKLRLLELPKHPDEVDQEISLNAGEGGGDENPDDSLNADSQKTPPSKRPIRSGPQDRYIAPEMKSYTPVYRFGHDLLVSTKVGNSGEKLFLLDTGAIDNMISPEAAREVTKVARDDTRVKGISGSVNKVYTANKAVLQFGHLRQENQDMLAFDLTSMSEGAGTEVSGTLGFTLLRLLEIKIDYRDGLVDFNYDPKRLNHF